MKIRLITFLCLLFGIAANASTTTAPKAVESSDIKAEQRVAAAMIKDATNDLEHASKAYANKTYKYSWVYLTDCGVKLGRVKTTLKNQPARIQVAVNFLGIGLSSTSRNALSKDYYKLKDDLDHALMLMDALEQDLGRALGVDVTWVRQMLSALKQLCETMNEPEFCEAYERAKALMDAGDVQGVMAILDNAALKKKVQESAISNGIDAPVSGPKTGGVSSTSSTSSSGATSASQSGTAPDLADIISRLQADCDNGNASACEEVSALQAAQKAAESGDSAALASLDEIARLRDECEAGNSDSCDKLESALAVLAAAGAGQSGASSADVQPAPAVPAPVVPSGPTNVSVEGHEVTFLNGTGIKTTYVGGKGMRLKKETVLKLVDMNANPPYQEVSSRDWNFGIQNAVVQSAATGCVYRFALVEQGGREDYSIKSWTVTKSATGEVVASGTGSPFDVTFTVAGGYNIEVKGVTNELGSDFTIRSVIDVSF